MQLIELLKDIPGIKSIHGPQDVPVQGVSYDSRRVSQGDLFCALRGQQFDGHDYIAAALNAGSRIIACEDPAYRDTGEATWIICQNSREFLALASNRFYGHPGQSMTMVGITGTNGKTTTAYYLQHIMNASGRRTGRMGTTGVAYDSKEITTLHTTPESRDTYHFLANMRDHGIDSVVMEVSSHALDQFRVAGIPFDAALFTNLTQDHLDYHKDMESYFQAKEHLFRSLAADSKAFVNLDDPRGADMLTHCPAHAITYALDQPADYRLTAFQVDGTLVKLTILTPQGELQVAARSVGRFNYYNVLAASAIALELGVSPVELTAALPTLPAVPGRLENVSGKAPFEVFIDYAHTPDAMERVLGVLREAYPHSRLVCVFGCGGDRDRDKRPKMGAIASRLSDAIIITDDNPRSEPSQAIIDEILPGVDPATPRAIINDRTQAIETALAEAGESDVVAVLGKGHEDYQEVMGQRLPISDLAIIRRFREQHGY